PDLCALRRNSQVDIMRRLRCLQRHARVAGDTRNRAAKSHGDGPSQPPASVRARRKACPCDVDPELRDYLREWRRIAARQQNVPAFVVMHDTSLDEVCRKRPATIPELLGVSGFGEQNAEKYGLQIVGAFGPHRQGARTAATPA